MCEIVVLKVRSKRTKKLLVFRFLLKDNCSVRKIKEFLSTKFAFFDVDSEKVDRKMIDFVFEKDDFVDLIPQFHQDLYSES